MMFDAEEQRAQDVEKPLDRQTHLFGILQILKQGLLVPRHALVHVRGGVRVSVGLTRFTPKDSRNWLGCRPCTRRDGEGRLMGRKRRERDSPAQVRADLVSLTRASGMALRASRLEESSALGGIT